MKERIKILSFIIWVIVLATLNSCSQEDQVPVGTPCMDSTNIKCPNFDSCYIIGPTSAEFSMEYLFPSGPTWLMEESHFMKGSIRFTAIQEADTYTWFLGSEEISEKSFIRDFSNVLSGSVVTPTLIVNKIPKTNCFPNDNGIDTVSKSFLVIENCDFLFSKVWLGVWESSSNDTFEISFELYSQPGDSDCLGLKISNINGKNGGPLGLCENDSTVQFNCTWSHRRIEFNKYSGITSRCNSPWGFAEVQPDNQSIYIEYRLIFDQNNNGTFSDDEYETIPRKFIGIEKG